MNDPIGVGTGTGTLWVTDFPLSLPGAASSNVFVRHGFLGGLRVFVDGKRAQRGRRRVDYLVPMEGGGATEVTVRAAKGGVAPEVEAQGVTAGVGRRVQGAEWLWVGLPLILAVWGIFGNGSPLDILAGGLAFAANVRIFVNDGLSAGSRYLTSLASTALIAFIYLLIMISIVLFLL